MLRAVNRVLLGLLGLILLATGAAVLFGGLDLPRRWGVSLPSAWPWEGPDDVLLSDANRTHWRAEDWWWPALIALLTLVALVALWWALAQARRNRLPEVLVSTHDPDDPDAPPESDELGALLRGRALEDAVEAEAAALPGVERSRVRLSGRRAAPRARVDLALGAHAEPGETVERLRTGALERARTSVGLSELPTEVRLGRVRHRAERVN